MCSTTCRQDNDSTELSGSGRFRMDQSDVVKAALAGAHIVTVPYKMLIKMPFHQKTEETIKEFDSAWADFIAGQKK